MHWRRHAGRAFRGSMRFTSRVLRSPVLRNSLLRKRPTLQFIGPNWLRWYQYSLHEPPRSDRGGSSGDERSSEGAAEPAIPSPKSRQRLRKGLPTFPHPRPLRTPFPPQQLPQHILQNAAVSVVERLLRRIDPDQRVELDCSFLALGSNLHRAPCSEAFHHVADTADLEHFLARQPERLRVLAREELQRQNSHADQIRAVNALVAFGDHRRNSKQAGAFRRPIAR